MKRSANTTILAGRWLAIAVSFLMLAASLPMVVEPASAQGSASVSVTVLDSDGSAPLPFTRVQVVDSNGVDYGLLETNFNGNATFPVDPAGDVTFNVSIETPVACGIVPDPQVVGPLTPGETGSAQFVQQYSTDCDLGTLAAYRYTCPETFDTSSTDYQAWVNGCAEEVNGEEFEFVNVATQQSWQPVTGDYGIAGRAPIVGLPPGQYTMEQVAPLDDKPFAWFCLTYATPNYNTSPNSSDISRMDSPDGEITVNLNGNRVSCDMFVAPEPDTPAQPTSEPTTAPTGPTAEPIGTGTINDDVNFRSAPSLDSDVLGVLDPGDVVDILGPAENGFIPVRFNGQEGFVADQFVDIDGQSPEETATSEPTIEPTIEPTVAATETPDLPDQPIDTGTINDDVNFRTAPTLDSDVIDVLLPGDVVGILGQSVNGFVPVQHDGVNGWTAEQFVDIGVQPADDTPTAEPTLTPTLEPTAPPISTTVPIGTGTINDDVNFRTEPNLDSDVIDVLLPGEIVEILGQEQNGFVPVRSGDENGFVAAQYVDIDGEGGDDPTETPTQTETATATVPPQPTTEPVGQATTTSEVNMRAEANLTSEVLEVVPPGTVVELLGEAQSGFFPVRYLNQEGFISVDFMITDSDAAETQTAEAVEPADSEGILELHLAACPAGYDTNGPIFDDCHDDGLDGITFNIVGPSSFSDQAVTTIPQSPGPGVVIFDELDAGTYTVNEDIPGDFNSIFVFCSLSNSDITVPFTYNEGIDGIDIESDGTSHVICDWYIIPDQQLPETGTVQVIKRTCQEGYDASESTFNDFINDCPTLTDGVTFGLIPDGIAETPTRTTGDDGEGTATFTDVFLGLHFLEEQTTDEFTTPYAYCGPDLNNLGAVQVTNNRVNVEPTQQNPDVVCLWFNVPEPPPGDPGTLEFHKGQCPAGYIPDDSIFDNCHDSGLAGVTFFIEGPDNYANQGVTSIPQSPGPGVVAFGDLEAGTYTINEDVPGDFTSIYVFCSLANSDTVVPFQYRQDIQGIDIEVGEGEYIICDWYNIPDPPQTGTVITYKRTCPVGYDASDATFSDFITDCPTLTNGITFGLVPDGIAETPTRTTGQDGPGRAVFTNVYMGLHFLWEQGLDEFTTPYAYCGPDLNNLSAVPVDNGRTGVEPTTSNPEVYCLWFDVIEDQSNDPATLTFNKFHCPERTTSDYWTRCSPNPLANATFDLVGPGNTAGSSVTDALGGAGFVDLPAGNYVIQEIPPQGVDVQVYVVACHAGGAAYKFTYDDSSGMKIRLSLPPGGEVHCNWYNVPKPTIVPPPPVTDDDGSITVHKLVCTGKQVASYNWATDCLIETSGEGFKLSVPNGGAEIVEGTIDTNGTLVFAGLENGTYELDETTGDWCHAEADKVDSFGNVIVTNDENTDVFIYNCGEVGSLPNTGVGDSAGEQPWMLILMMLGGATAMLGFALRVRSRRPSLVPARVQRRS